MKPKTLKQIIEEAQNLLANELDKLNPLLAETIIDSFITGASPHTHPNINKIHSLQKREVELFVLANTLHLVKHERRGYYIYLGANKRVPVLAKQHLDKHMEVCKFRKRYP